MLLLVWIVPPLVDFLIIDAVWAGASRDDCLRDAGAAGGRRLLGLRQRPHRLLHLRLLSDRRALAGRRVLRAARGRRRLDAVARRAAPRPRRDLLLRRAADRCRSSCWSAGRLIGLPDVETALWGGVLVTIVVAAVGIVVSLPLGILLALGRRSQMPVVRLFSRHLHRVRARRAADHRAVHGERDAAAVRAGQPDRRTSCCARWSASRCSPRPTWPRWCAAACRRSRKGQYEGAMALGLGYWQMMRLIILPQALQGHHPEHRQHLHRPVQGHDAGLHRRHLRPPQDHRGGARRPELGDAGDQRHRLCLRRDLLFRLLLRACRAMRGTSSAASRRATGAEGPMASSNATRPNRASSRRTLNTDGRGRDRRRAQVVRRVPRAARHQPARHARRAHRHLRAVRLRQVDHDPLHQPAGGAPEGPHRRRRHRTHQRPQADRRDPPRGRHGVPALQPVPAPDRAGELHAGADLGAQDAQGGGRGDRDALPPAREDPRAGRQISGPALRRPAAARRDRARAVHEPEDHAVRRADLGARPGNGQGGARHHGASSPRTA